MLTNFNFDPISIVALLITLSLAPFIALLVSSFVKIVIVMTLVRNALGVQQVPPNMVLNGLAIMLSLYIMYPVINDTAKIAMNTEFKADSLEEVVAIVNKVKVPLQNFLAKHASEIDRSFFIRSAQKLWPKELISTISRDDFIVLLPAFTVTELTSSFQIGFLLYLPFIAIDLIVSNILLALGMMMVSPMTISLPFKLMLFVLVNGWGKMIQGLVLTYR
ncbi:MAG: type III secretion system export apparatus subunit SctR [Puniceicoccales bacterium]|jgi:type III secretion protein R|nr:type III secretion system export apparatus subunit SctR [Puniceicoccales bacterium]